MQSIQVKNPSLVLSGGGMKAAAFHIGVSLALEKARLFTHGSNPTDSDIVFERYVGASAGSVISSFFAAGLSPQDVIYAFTQGKHNLDTLNVSNLTPTHKLPKLKYRDIFNVELSRTQISKWVPNLLSSQFKSKGGLESLLKSFFKVSGFFSTKGLGDYFNKHILEDGKINFADLEKELFIVATFLDRPKKAIFSKFDKPIRKTSFDEVVYMQDVSIAEAITASAALPPIFTPVEINGEAFFDGEIRDSLSSHIALDQNSDLVIVSYSMQPYKYNAQFGSLSQYGLPVIANQALYQLIQQKITNHVKSKLNLRLLFKDLESSLQKHMPKDDIENLIHELETKFFPTRSSKVIYIHPSARDYEMFFADHLSLKPEVLNKIVTIGFKAAMNSLRPYNFTKA